MRASKLKVLFLLSPLFVPAAVYGTARWHIDAQIYEAWEREALWVEEIEQEKEQFEEWSRLTKQLSASRITAATKLLHQQRRQQIEADLQQYFSLDEAARTEFLDAWLDDTAMSLRLIPWPRSQPPEGLAEFRSKVSIFRDALQQRRMTRRSLAGNATQI